MVLALCIWVNLTPSVWTVSQTLLRGFLSSCSRAEYSSTTLRGGEPFPSSPTSKNFLQQTNNPQPFPSLSPTPRYCKCCNRFEETFACSDWVLLVRKEPFAIWVWSLQLGFGAFQCWRSIGGYNMCWISWLECKHFSVTFWGIWVQPQFQGTTARKLFPVALLYAVTQLNSALTALWLSFSASCWCWMLATGNRNEALSLDSSMPYGENIQDQLGKPLFWGNRMPWCSTRQVGNRSCKKKSTKGKGSRFISEHKEGGRIQKKMTTN